MINIFKAPEEPKKVVEEKIQISITKREKQQVTEPVTKGTSTSSQNGAFYLSLMLLVSSISSNITSKYFYSLIHSDCALPQDYSIVK